MAFSETNFPIFSLANINFRNPNVAIMMCQSLEGRNSEAFSSEGCFPHALLLSQEVKVRGVFRRQRGSTRPAVFVFRIQNRRVKVSG